MNLVDLIKRIKYWLWEATKILALIVAVSVLVSILFGPSTAFFGGVLTNLEPIIATLGSEGLAVIIALILILGIWNGRS
tara:strand:- start:49 stop:285 length:237 start_codon:yes stop_codon:yes gene_type:complete